MIYTYICIFLVLIILSALCSGTENSYCSVNKHSLKRAAFAQGAKRRQKLAYKIYKNFTRYLATILLLNNLINLAISSLSVSIVYQLFSEKFAFLGTIISVIFIIIFSEITPKILARKLSLSWVTFSSNPLYFLHIVFLPLTYIFDMLACKIERKNKKNEKTETEDIENAFEKIEDEGLIENNEAILLQNTIDFQDTPVFEIATPRIDIDGIDIEDRKEVIIQIASGTRFSRLLVYKGSRDIPIGITFTKNILKFIIDNPECTTHELVHDIEENMLDILYLYKTMPLNKAYMKMKKENIHIAVVDDEFGGTYGIVTMEDVLEELVGEIWDESDTIKPDMKKIGRKTWKIKGDLSIDDFFDRVECQREDDDIKSTTIGGLAWEMLGENLKKYDKFEFNSFQFEVRRIEKRRVVFLNATKIN